MREKIVCVCVRATRSLSNLSGGAALFFFLYMVDEKMAVSLPSLFASYRVSSSYIRCTLTGEREEGREDGRHSTFILSFLFR